MEHDTVGEILCEHPPRPGGIALMAAADGDGDEETLQHLRSCVHCARRVAELQAAQRELRRRLYRAFCPPTEQLVDYCQGLLDPASRARLTHHILTCPHCAAELSLLEQSDAARHVSGPATLFVVRPAR